MYTFIMSRNEFKNIKILFVDDEENIRLNAVSYLKRLCDDVYSAKDVFEAMDVVETIKPHILITDIQMPKMNGLEMIRRIRQKNKNINIIVLSAHTQSHYLFEAIELNLVKYLVKPIRHDSLYPALIQCTKNLNENSCNHQYLSSSCFYDSLNKTLYINELPIKLSKRENDFLQLLCENANQVVTYDHIQAVVWEDDFMSDDALRSVARNLRRKLPQESLENHSKIGYKIITIK